MRKVHDPGEGFDVLKLTDALRCYVATPIRQLVVFISAFVV